MVEQPLFFDLGKKPPTIRTLAREFPHMLTGYKDLYAAAYANAEYLTGVRGMIGTLQKRYHVKRRESERRASSPVEPEKERAVCEQAALDWDE